ncbi:hypothetical protein NFI96_031629, partial [Prochilodus magdalenae]
MFCKEEWFKYLQPQSRLSLGVRLLFFKAEGLYCWGKLEPPGKAQVASLLLGRKTKGSRCEFLCVLHKSETQAGKEDLNPHVLILVLPVANLSPEPPSADELETVQKHWSFYLERVWKHNHEEKTNSNEDTERKGDKQQSEEQSGEKNKSSDKDVEVSKGPTQIGLKKKNTQREEVKKCMQGQEQQQKQEGEHYMEETGENDMLRCRLGSLSGNRPD